MRYFLLILLALLVPSPAFADQLQDGKNAFYRGDYKTALKLLQPLADQGNPYAEVKMGEMCNRGYCVIHDPAAAAAWFQKALKQLLPLAEKGDAMAQNTVGVIYDGGWGIKKDEQEGLKWIRKAADRGNAWAESNLAYKYLYGRGVPKDYKRAMKLFHLAANQGLAQAQIELGRTYEQDRNHDEARKWYLKAAKQGYLEAQRGLADISRAMTDAKNARIAAKWYLIAAKQGDVHAQYMLGAMYENGEGVEQNFAEAGKWYRAAAANKDDFSTESFVAKEKLDAQNNLCWMYFAGSGVKKDTDKALSCLLAIANEGNDEAQYVLFTLYLKGTPEIKQSYEEAYFWMSLYTSPKHLLVRHFVYILSPDLANFTSKLTKEQKDAVDKRVSAWKPAPVSLAGPKY